MGWDWLNYVPIASNIKGAVEGNVAQAALGPAYQIPGVRKVGDSLSGQTSADAASKAANDQRTNSQNAAQLAWNRQQYTVDQTKQNQGYFNNANQQYQNLYGAGSGPAAGSNTYSGSTYPGFNASSQFGLLSGTAPGTLTTPGYGEQAYASHGNDYLGLNASQNYYQNQGQQLNGPSAAESYFNPAAYQKTTNAENFYNQNQGRYRSNVMNDAYPGLFNSLGSNNSAIQQNYQGLMGRLSGPADTTSLYHDTYNQYNNDAMTSALGGLTSRLSGPGSTQDLYDGQGYKYDQNTMGNEWKNYLSSALDPNRGVLHNTQESIDNALLSTDMQETVGNDVRQGLLNSNSLSGNLDNMLGHAQGNLADRNAQGQGLINQEAGPSSTQQEYGNIRGAYGGPGQFENFVQGAMSGNDPYFDMLQRDQTRNLDASINARGGFNSGAAIRAQGVQNSDLEAKKYAQLASLAQGAQGMQLQRAAGLQGLSGQTEGEIQQRLKAQDTIGQELYGNQSALTGQEAALRQAGGQEQRDIQNAIVNQASQQDAARLARTMGRVNLGQATDASTLQYLQQRAGAANMASQSDLAYLQGKANLAMGADQATLGRVTESGNLANMAATQRLNYMGQRANLANMSDVNTLGRVTESGNLANMASVDQYNRTMGQGQLSNMTAGQNLNYLNSQQSAAMGADNSYLNLLQGGQQAANSASSAQLARIMGGGQLAQNSDVQGRNNLSGYFNQANQAQQMAEQRQQAALSSAMALGSAQAGLGMQGLGMANNEYDRWMESSMGLQGNANAIGMNAANAQQQQYWNLLAAGASAFGGPGAGMAVRQGGQVFQQPQTMSPQLNAQFTPPNFSSNSYVPYQPNSMVPPLQMQPQFQGPNPYPPTW